MAQSFVNTAIISVPAVLITLFVSSMLGFVFSRYSFRGNLLLLMLFTAGNLLPPQVIIVPLYRMFLLLPLPAPLSDAGTMYDTYFGVILINIVFQTGFCTFVLSNYMKTISRELSEAAVVDGASVWLTYRKVIMPLARPALAALAVLEFTFIYNDFFWALILMKPQRQATDHERVEQVDRRVLQQLQRVCGGRLHRRHPDGRPVPDPLEAIRPRPDAGVDQGLGLEHEQPGAEVAPARRHVAIDAE